MTNGTKQTHVEDAKDPSKVLLPTGNLVLVTLCEDESGNHMPFAMPDDLPMDPCHHSAIETPVSGSSDVCTVGLAHLVRSPIASKTGWLS